MARKPNARVELNRSKLNEVQLGIAQGLHELAVSIAQDASSQVTVSTDDWHIRDHWGAATYVDGKKVLDTSSDGSATAKPREFRAPKGLSAIAGFDFPARFLEVGTSDTAAQPFLSPASTRGAERAGPIIRDALAPTLRKP